MIALFLLTLCFINVISFKDEDKCEALIGKDIIKEIESYAPIRDKILKFVLEGDFKGRTYKELAQFIDKFGARPSGTDNLERSIDYLIEITQREDLHFITTEKVKVPQWTRLKEELVMLAPRKKNLAMIGLGNSVSTPKDGITAELIVVNNFDEFDNKTTEEVKGKIVLFNAIFVNYFQTVAYRYEAATRAATKGAVASLIRSITPFSINSPHTGLQEYGKNVTKIPTAAITLEDANFLRRLYENGEKIELHLEMFSKLDLNKISRNTLVDFVGREEPDQQVIVSGHVDSWDIGEGAMDDGGGLFISWAVPVILKKLGLVPKRTIRSIFWTSEEQGYIGAYAYEKEHRNELDKINFIMESDEGTFTPLGLQMSGSLKAKCIIAEVLKLFKVMNATQLLESDEPSSDINVITDKGVPGAGLLNDNHRYWWFHHSAGDRMDVEDGYSLDLCSAFWTAVAYIVADISADIPR